MELLNKLFGKKVNSSVQRTQEVSELVHKNKDRIQENILKYGSKLDRLAETSAQLRDEFKNSVAFDIYKATGGKARTKKNAQL